jgi:transposase InsO family protein
MPRIGTRKLYYLLEDQLKDLNIGRDKLFRILKANKMLIKPKKNYTTTTNSHHRFKKHKNMIENMEINRPDQVWVSDITYLGTRGNHRYLSLITDAYSKKIVGYNLSDSLATEGSLQALEMAIKSSVSKELNVIHHSDRGLQYCSDDYQKVLSDTGIKVSMTEKYDPYQNAIAERVNGTIKNEFELNKHLDSKYLSQIIDQTVSIYNSLRPHYSNGYLTPNQMHMQSEIKPICYKSKNHFKDILKVV